MSSRNENNRTAKPYTSDEKKRIMERLHEERKRKQQTIESLKKYLSDKKIYHYKGEEYYKVSDYKNSFYIKKSDINALDATVMEVELERAGYASNRSLKGLVKWDNIRETLLLSTSKIRIYYKPFHIEKS